MIRRPPRSTLSSSSAASDVYKRQIVCRIAFHRCAEGEDNFINTSCADLFFKALDLEIRGPDTIYRRNNSAEDMVHSPELAGVFESHHILYVLDDTDN